ncbi:MAG: phytanoyl-CoA dioxygenase family protein [Alphaproteobacteria bacterium]
MQNGTAAVRLDADEAERYRADGLVVPRLRLDDATLARLRAALDRVLADNPDHRPENLMNVHIADGPEGVRGQQAFLDLAHDDRILDLVEPLIGPDLILWGCALFCKPAGAGRAVPWHQDGHYWPIRPLATCTVWVALDRSDTGNGCMRYVAGSHRHGLMRHRTNDADGLALNQELDPDLLDAGAMRDVVLDPGEMSLHDVFLVHGSNANTSDRRRAGVVLRYMPATSLFDRDVPPVPGTSGTSAPNFAARPIFLVRGEDRTGRNVMRPAV